MKEITFLPNAIIKVRGWVGPRGGRGEEISTYS